MTARKLERSPVRETRKVSVTPLLRSIIKAAEWSESAREFRDRPYAPAIGGWILQAKKHLGRNRQTSALIRCYKSR